MLEIQGLEVSYGHFQVLWGVDLEVYEGQVVCVLGPNGAGKSTIVNAVTGLVARQGGRVLLGGEDLAGVSTHAMAERGLIHVLERRRLFPTLSIRQNLILGSYNPEARRHRDEPLAWVQSLFPLLEERADERAGVLSGGQQQIVAIARGLMGRPRVMMIDEPFLGLSPVAVEEIVNVIRRINETGVTILFTEQNVQLALSLSDHGYLLESGKIVLSSSGREMLEHEMVRQVYLGIS